jgi:hypothetical protein
MMNLKFWNYFNTIRLTKIAIENKMLKQQNAYLKAEIEKYRLITERTKGNEWELYKRYKISNDIEAIILRNKITMVENVQILRS